MWAPACPAHPLRVTGQPAHPPRRVLVGGNFQAAGGYACTFVPALPVTDPQPPADNPSDPHFIGRVMTPAAAAAAAAKLALMEQVDPTHRYGVYASYGGVRAVRMDLAAAGAGGMDQLRKCTVKTLKDAVQGAVQAASASASAADAVAYTHPLSQIIMQRAPDGDFYAWLQRNTATAASRTPWGLRACLLMLANAFEGLSVYHAGGVVHRDVKPDNMVVMSRDSGVKDADAAASVGAGARSDAGASARLRVIKFIDFDTAASFETLQTQPVALTASHYTPLVSFAVSVYQDFEAPRPKLTTVIDTNAPLFMSASFAWRPSWGAKSAAIAMVAYSNIQQHVKADMGTDKPPWYAVFTAAMVHQDIYALASMTLAQTYWAFTGVVFTHRVHVRKSMAADGSETRNTTFEAFVDDDASDLSRVSAETRTLLAPVTEVVGALVLQAALAQVWSKDLVGRFAAVLQALDDVLAAAALAEASRLYGST